MKEKIKYLILIVSLLFTISSVKAAQTQFTNSSRFTAIPVSGSEYKVPGMTDGVSQFGLYIYDFKSTSDGNSFTSYCMDPHKRANRGQSQYKIERVLGDSKSKAVQAFDAGIQEIIKNGYNQYNNSYKLNVNTPEIGNINTTISGNNLYIATSIAIRAYSLGLFGFGTDLTFSVGGPAASAHITRGVQWASYHKDKVNVINPTNCSSNNLEEWGKCYVNNYIKNKAGETWYNSKYNLTVDNNTPSSYAIIYAAYELFVSGLDKAYEAYTGTIKTQTIKAEIQKNTKSIEKSNTTETVYMYADFTVNNFSATNGKVTNINVVCNDCQRNGARILKTEIRKPGTDTWENLTNQINILDYLTADGNLKSGKIETRITVSKPVGDENCSNSSFKITYDYTDPNLVYSGVLLKTNDAQAQRFFIIQKNEDVLKGEVEGTIKCSSLTCETTLEEPICSYDETKAVATIKTNSNIKKCIIDKNDDANNSYQFTESAGGVDNAYCKVFCKEDYAEIKLNPIVQNVKCGGYFKLTSKINGTKTCYTGGNTTDKSINKAEYEKDIEQAIKEMIDAWNIYSYYKAAVAADPKADSISGSDRAEGGCCTSCCNPGPESTCTPSTCSGGDTTRWRVVTNEWTFDYYDFNGVKHTNQSSYRTLNGTTLVGRYSDGSVTSCGCCSCEPSDIGAFPDHSSQKANALKTLQAKISKYEKIITDYNACTTAWTNEFAFAQKLKYYYDERRDSSNTSYSPYYDLIKSKEELQYLEKYGLEKVSTKITICTGATDDEYNCINTRYTKELDLSIDKNRISDYNYNSSYTDIFELKNYIKCSEGSCAIDSKSYVSQALFVKKEVTKEQNYITPTSFYQIAANGKVVAYNDYSIDKVQLEPLVNKLPISTSSVGGGTFKLIIENLGEFYGEKNAYGRLIDYGKSNEHRSVANAVGVNGFDGNYVCHYENQCRPKDCPNCDFVCEGENCNWVDCPNCDFVCVNCIFNLDDLNITVKTITTTDVDAAKRTPGFNWITPDQLNDYTWISSTTREALQLVSKKASTTISEIESVNEMIYDDKTTDGSRLGFSIRLTPAIIKKITKYNQDNLNSGGYLNNSLKCYDATINGETYKNMYCYSELIDELVKDAASNKDVNIAVLPSRINDEARRASESGNSGYWTLWSNYSIDKTSESVIGGPAWK